MTLIPDDPSPPSPPPKSKPIAKERRARQDDQLMRIRFRVMIGRELDERGITTPAGIGEALGMSLAETTKLLTRHQWREGGLLLLQAAAAGAGAGAGAAGADTGPVVSMSLSSGAPASADPVQHKLAVITAEDVLGPFYRYRTPHVLGAEPALSIRGGRGTPPAPRRSGPLPIMGVSRRP